MKSEPVEWYVQEILLTIYKFFARHEIEKQGEDFFYIEESTMETRDE